MSWQDDKILDSMKLVELSLQGLQQGQTRQNDTVETEGSAFDFSDYDNPHFRVIKRPSSLEAERLDRMFYCSNELADAQVKGFVAKRPPSAKPSENIMRMVDAAMEKIKSSEP